MFKSLRRVADARPDRARAEAPVVEPIWLEWLALGGLLAFGTWLLACAASGRCCCRPTRPG